MIANELKHRLWTNTEVVAITQTKDSKLLYLVECKDSVTGALHRIKCEAAVVCINRRLGKPRQVTYPNEEYFSGAICYGMGREVEQINFEGTRVAIIGMGAFAIENTRTALERDALHVSIICRHIGGVCPLVIVYLNFA